MKAWLAKNRSADVFVVVATEQLRSEALAVVQQLRDAGLRVDFSLAAAKVGKQFQAAEQTGAQFAVLFGEEWPMVSVKTLATRAEQRIPHAELADWIRNRQKDA
jgi:histidyl-tRNA synthetase